MKGYRIQVYDGHTFFDDLNPVTLTLLTVSLCGKDTTAYQIWGSQAQQLRRYQWD